MSRPLLLAGGRVIDPSSDTDDVQDVLIVGGRIESVGRGIAGPDDAERVSVEGLVVAVRMAVLYLLAGGRPELAESAKAGEP